MQWVHATDPCSGSMQRIVLSSDAIPAVTLIFDDDPPSAAAALEGIPWADAAALKGSNIELGSNFERVFVS